jgi:hypothetical protein
MKKVVIGNAELNLGEIDITSSEAELTNFINFIYNKTGNIGFGLLGLTITLISSYSLISMNIV